MGITVVDMATSSTALIALRVRLSLDAAKETIVALASATGIPRTSLTRKLDGHTDFTIPELQAISRHLEVEMFEWLRDLPKLVA